MRHSCFQSKSSSTSSTFIMSLSTQELFKLSRRAIHFQARAVPVLSSPSGVSRAIFFEQHWTGFWTSFAVIESRQLAASGWVKQTENPLERLRGRSLRFFRDEGWLGRTDEKRSANILFSPTFWEASTTPWLTHHLTPLRQRDALQSLARCSRNILEVNNTCDEPTTYDSKKLSVHFHPP